MDKNLVLSFPKLSTHFLSLFRNMQKMEKTDELNRSFESLSNRHILKRFKRDYKKLSYSCPKKRATLISLF